VQTSIALGSCPTSAVVTMVDKSGPVGREPSGDLVRAVVPIAVG
jgi:hypothetical protein